jgi:hypothetical protein
MDGTRGRESGAAPTEIPTPQEELVIFVERLMHFMNVWTVYRDLLSGHYVPTVGAPSESDPFPNMTVTMMFLLYASFYSLIEEDEKSVNAFRVWRQHFPKEESAIAAVEAQVTPFTKDLKRFRNRLGFHGSRSRAHEASGFDLFAKHSGSAILTAMANFKRLGAVLLAKEKEARRTKESALLC